MFKPTKAKTPEEYIKMIDEPRRTEIQKLYDFIKQTLPGEKPFILYGMIGFVPYHYKSSSGREGDWCVIALASQKNYISVYVCASNGKQYVAEKYKKDLPKTSIGKSCIRFKKTADIDLTVLKKVILDGVKTAKSSGFAL